MLFLMWIYLYLIMIFMIFKSNMSITQTIIMLMIFTILITLILSNSSTWSIYSFLLFLMIISGLMILFMLFMSLISNQFMPMTNKKKMITLFILFSIMFILKYLNFTQTNYSLLFNNHMFMNYTNISMKINNLNSWMNINYLYNLPMNMFIILMIILLLIMLLAITKICLVNIKPLRSTKK
uniref:NADH dehydrogenase subunit 6 n=1 Tax=Vespula orbata TaxID=2684586 RepID=UPI0030FE0A34